MLTLLQLTPLMTDSQYCKQKVKTTESIKRLIITRLICAWSSLSTCILAVIVTLPSTFVPAPWMIESELPVVVEVIDFRIFLSFFLLRMSIELNFLYSTRYPDMSNPYSCGRVHLKKIPSSKSEFVS